MTRPRPSRQTLFKRLAAEGVGGSSAALSRGGGGGGHRSSYETGPFCFHVLAEGGVCYLTLCDKSYPKKLAYQACCSLNTFFVSLCSSKQRKGGQ